jgi:hypothetical protein
VLLSFFLSLFHFSDRRSILDRDRDVLFFLATPCRQALVPSQPPIQWVKGKGKDAPVL